MAASILLSPQPIDAQTSSTPTASERPRLEELPILRGRQPVPLPAPDAGPVVDTARERLLTWSADAGTAFWRIARAHLDRRQMPGAPAMRPADFANALSLDRPTSGDAPLTLTAELFASSTRTGGHVLRLGVHARAIGPGERRPTDLVVVAPATGPQIIDDALVDLRKALAKDDRLGLVSYDGRSFDLLGDLLQAYEQAAKGATPGRDVRVLLLVNAGSGVRPASGDVLARLRRQGRQGRTLTVLIFGAPGADLSPLSRLASAGDGELLVIDNAAEARRVFSAGFPDRLAPVARRVKVQLDLRPRAVARYRFLSDPDGVLASSDFTGEGGGGVLGAGRSATTLVEVKLTETVRPDRSRPDRSRPGAVSIGTLRVHYEADGISRIVERPLVLALPGRADVHASARLAWIASTFGEKLAGSPWVRDVSYRRLIADLDALDDGVRTAPAAAELRYLVGRARDLDRRRPPTPGEGAFDSLRVLE